MAKITKYPAVTSPADADVVPVVQSGVTKKIALSVLKTYMGAGDLKNNFDGARPPAATDDETDGYSAGSVWIDAAASPKEAYKCLDAGADAAVWIKTTLSIDELGSGALREIAAATAENDFLVGGSSPFGWIKKTLDDVKTLLGLSAKADKVAASPDPSGYIATFDAAGNLVTSAKTVAGLAEPPTPTAADDFQVATGSPPAWAKKTTAETKEILGINVSLATGAKAALINQVLDIVDPSKISVFAIFDETGAATAIIDRSTIAGNAAPNDIDLVDDDGDPIAASTMSPGRFGNAPYLTADATHQWEIADADSLSAVSGSPASDTPLYVALVGSITDASFWGVAKGDFANIEWALISPGAFGSSKLTFRVATSFATNDNLAATSTATGEALEGQTLAIIGAYDGSETATGIELFINGETQVAGDENGTYAGMAAGAGKLTSTMDASAYELGVHPSLGKFSVLIVGLEALTSTQVKRLDVALRAFAGIWP